MSSMMATVDAESLMRQLGTETAQVVLRLFALSHPSPRPSEPWAVAFGGEPRTVAELAALCGRGVSTMYRHLLNARRKGFLRLLPGPTRSLKVLEFAMGSPVPPARSHNDSAPATPSAIQELREEVVRLRHQYEAMNERLERLLPSADSSQPGPGLARTASASSPPSPSAIPVPDGAVPSPDPNRHACNQNSTLLPAIRHVFRDITGRFPTVTEERRIEAHLARFRDVGAREDDLIHAMYTAQAKYKPTPERPRIECERFFEGFFWRELRDFLRSRYRRSAPVHTRPSPVARKSLPPPSNVFLRCDDPSRKIDYDAFYRRPPWESAAG